jgi:thioredoxin 1
MFEIPSKGFVFVKFSATWCMPCKNMIPIVDKLEKEFGDLVLFKHIDVDDEDPSTTKKYMVRSVPLVILFKDGVEASRIDGLHREDYLRQQIKETFGL